MDNIGLTDRSQKLPPGYLLDQADGAGWISLLCLNLMRIALTLAKKNPNYEGLGIKFFQHFIYVTAAMRKGYWRSYDMWNKKDGFFYSRIRAPDGSTEEIPIRALDGIIPFFACDLWTDEELRQFPSFYRAYEWVTQKRSHLASKCIQTITQGTNTYHFFGLLTGRKFSSFYKTFGVLMNFAPNMD